MGLAVFGPGYEIAVLAGPVASFGKLLTLELGAVPPEHQAVISNATLEQLDRYVTKVLFAETLESVFAD